MKFDLHVHSFYSDGVKSVFELAAAAKEKGLSGFALTDHDTIDGWQDIPAASAEYDMIIVPGVEFSTKSEGHTVHILGYCMTDIEPLSEKLADLAMKRRKRIEKMTEKISALGYDITFDEVLAEAGRGTVGRPHIAAVLAEKGFVRSRQAAFDKLLERGKPGYVPRDPYPSVEAVALILRCGGVPVLAHPGLDEAFLQIDNLVDAGLKGIEAYHSAHTAKTAAKFAAEAAEKGLFITAGSDYHGFGEVHGQLGSVTLDENTPLPPFLEKYLKGA